MVEEGYVLRHVAVFFPEAAFVEVEKAVPIFAISFGADHPRRAYRQDRLALAYDGRQFAVKAQHICTLQRDGQKQQDTQKG